MTTNRQLSIFYLSILAFFLPIFANGQSFADKLFEQHDSFKDASIETRRFKHSDIIPIIKKLPAPFEVETLGESMEGRAIYSIKIGSGNTKVLLWSQMHGDEPTATMAIMDIFNFFLKKEQFEREKQEILNNLTLYFVPMLNPDGAYKFRRRTALQVDLNRDALRLQTPEGQILKKIRDELEADWGFNLHDQSRYYSVGTSNKTATVSFLAPAFNYAKDINPVRKKSMQQIGLMNETLQKFMPGHVAKYDDDFEPRAFGDNIQKWGTSTILIESGGYKNDPEKQFIRKMNFIGLLTAFQQIANKEYKSVPLEKYENIPFNARYFHEFLIRKARIRKGGQPYILDIGFRRDELQFNQNRSFYYDSYISDLGDLSTFHGYEELLAEGYEILPGKLYPKTLKNFKKLERLNLQKLHQEGYTAVKIKNLKNEKRKLALPIELLAEFELFNPSFHLGANPSFFLVKNGQKEMVVINGKVFKLSNDEIISPSN